MEARFGPIVILRTPALRAFTPVFDGLWPGLEGWIYVALRDAGPSRGSSG
jgi:hypothetical protein